MVDGKDVVNIIMWWSDLNIFFQVIRAHPQHITWSCWFSIRHAVLCSFVPTFLRLTSKFFHYVFNFTYDNLQIIDYTPWHWLPTPYQSPCHYHWHQRAGGNSEWIPNDTDRHITTTNMQGATNGFRDGEQETGDSRRRCVSSSWYFFSCSFFSSTDY